MTSVGQNNSFSKIARSLRFSNGTYMCSPVLDVVSLPQAGLYPIQVFSSLLKDSLSLLFILLAHFYYLQNAFLQ